MSNLIPVVDVFAGCGGLSEGFNQLRTNGTFPFEVRLHIEKETSPIKTLELRSFYHQFRDTRTPDDYYEYVSGSIDREELFQRHPRQAELAKQSCLQFELGNLASNTDTLNRRIKEVTEGNPNWVLIGGPPCQAYSTIGRVRNKSVAGYDPESDVRLELYQEYLEIIATHWPAVFVMENVRGLLSASVHNQSVFQRMIDDLSTLGSTSGQPNPRYRIDSLTTESLGNCRLSSDPTSFVVKAEEYGVPQARHRVILLGVRDDITLTPEPLMRLNSRLNASEVLDDLPKVRSGLSTHDSLDNWLSGIREITKQDWWHEVEPKLRQKIHDAVEGLVSPPEGRGGLHVDINSSCSYKSDWFTDERLTGTLNHEARTHRKDDLWRYLYAVCAKENLNRPFRISDFPAGLRPRHKNIKSAIDNGTFADRFSVVSRSSPSRTVVSHIRKDGHYYIHYDPTQCRSLTVREAARLQTFPDNYYFEGSRTDQYGQVGNAVPPLLSLQIADRVEQLLANWKSKRNGHSNP